MAKKATTYAVKNLNLAYTKSSYLLQFKNLFIPLFTTSHDTFEGQVFRNNAIPLRIYLL